MIDGVNTNMQIFGNSNISKNENVKSADNNNEIQNIFNMMDESALDSYIANGFMTTAKNSADGKEYYVFDTKKYEEATGKKLSVGELSYMLGLEFGVIRNANEDFEFKDYFNEPRDVDMANVTDVISSGKVKIPKEEVFKENGERDLGLY